jgi:hypothetical protein
MFYRPFLMVCGRLHRDGVKDVSSFPYRPPIGYRIGARWVP